LNWRFIREIRKVFEEERGYKLHKRGGDVNILLIFPNRYSLSISNLGYLTIYKLFNEQKGILCERAYIPENFPKETKFPLLSIETQKSAKEFDILAFSLSFELDYFNVVKILSMENIPLFWYERGEDYPLIISGGIAVSSNPEPVADIFDLIFIGEGENFIENFSELLIQWKKDNLRKEKLLEKASYLKGVYIPRFSKPIYNDDGKILKYESFQNLPIKKEINNNFYQKPIFSPIISPLSFFSNMVLLEGGRGCMYNCRFCLSGHFYKPYRKTDLSIAIKEINKLFTSNKKIGLILPSIDKSISWNEIKEFLKENEILISFSSLRLDQLDDNILEILNKSKQKTLTIAPETGSDRLRKFLNKNFSNKDIIEFVYKIKNLSISNLKLYFMYGLPTEDFNDIKSIVELIKEIRSILKTQISISLSCFIPKPHTPFQWEKMEREEYFIKKQEYIRREIFKIENVELQKESIELSILQGIISRGDRRLSKIWKMNKPLKRLIKNLIEEKNFYIFRERERDEFFPWDIIDIGINKEYLWNEREKAYNERGL
jgi:radical SAM superfamily enzyme YgiQ (UPF0313 family)